MTLENYLDLVKNKLDTSTIIKSFSIIDERILFTRGYFRARITLMNEDFLEIAESCTIINDRLVTLSYRYQWMNKTKQILRKRWDNVEHFPDLPNFPHHVHIEDESMVEPSESRSILQIINLIEHEIKSREV
ncbi:MAG: hypothetical protein IGQ45_08510 [Cyanobacterium sp. T60_A2020_053]|nr:hypothetical protein [Cyanobacterium sp. T60_A2020_053]